MLTPTFETSFETHPLDIPFITEPPTEYRSILAQVLFPEEGSVLGRFFAAQVSTQPIDGEEYARSIQHLDRFIDTLGRLFPDAPRPTWVTPTFELLPHSATGRCKHGLTLGCCATCKEMDNPDYFTKKPTQTYVMGPWIDFIYPLRGPVSETHKLSKLTRDKGYRAAYGPHLHASQPKLTKYADLVAWEKLPKYEPRWKGLGTLHYFCPQCTERVLDDPNNVVRETRGYYRPREHDCGVTCVEMIPAAMKTARKSTHHALPQARIFYAENSNDLDGVVASHLNNDAAKRADSRAYELWEGDQSEKKVPPTALSCQHCGASVARRKSTKYCSNRCCDLAYKVRSKAQPIQ